MFKGANVLFRDITLLLSVSLMTVVFLLLLLINEEKKKEEEIKSPGNLIVEIFWPNDRNVDVDVWLASPEDNRPVYYSRKDGFIFSLLRDDLGHARDKFEGNSEIAFARGVVPGEYTINIHYFKNHASGGIVPVEVKTKVTFRVNSHNTIIYEGVKELRREGEEITVIRFTINANGEWVRNQNNDLNQPLRTKY